jgi:hypothetical protein
MQRLGHGFSGSTAWINRAVPTMRRLLPAFTSRRTTAELGGGSRKCREQTWPLRRAGEPPARPEGHSHLVSAIVGAASPPALGERRAVMSREAPNAGSGKSASLSNGLNRPGLIGYSMKPRRCAGRPTSALTLMPRTRLFVETQRRSLRMRSSIGQHGRWRKPIASIRSRPRAF